MNTENTSPTDQHQPQALSSAALARRHMLLKGLGKGSAVLAAAMPISTLAAPTIVTSNNKLCTVSGVQSQVSSQVTEKATCAGYEPSYYATLSNWPNYNGSVNPPSASNTVGMTQFSDKSKFDAIFGSGSSSNNIYLIVRNSSTADEAVWISALLNALGGKNNFPYTALEVVAFYKSNEKNAAALAFFRDFMQTLKA